MTSRADRELHVSQMLNNMRLADQLPDNDHLRMLQRYSEGTATLSDLLQDARNAALEQWLLEKLRSDMKAWTEVANREYLAANAKNS